MGQASRTTKVLLAVGKRKEGGANTEKRAALAATAAVLTSARAFYIDFFLAHAALCGYRSQGNSLGRATPLIQVRPACR